MATCRFRLLALFVAAFAYAQPYDVLIRGGKLVDGTGNPWRMADVAIQGGRIAAVGDLRTSRRPESSTRKAWWLRRASSIFIIIPTAPF